MKKKAKWKLAQFMELLWWKNYLGKKNKAEYLAWKKDYWNNFLNQLGSNLDWSKIHSVLDVGCGPAGIFMALPCKQIEALDPLLLEYEKNLPHFSRSEYPKVKFHAMAFEDFQSAAPFDAVFCLNAINHVSDLKGCYNKLADCTVDGGLLLVSIDAHNHSFFKKIFQWIPGDVLHPHQYDLAEYEAMLTDRNFEIIQTVNVQKGFFFDYYLQLARKKK